MRRFAFFLLCTLFVARGQTASAQAVPAATAPQVSVIAGGMISLFQPEFANDWTPTVPSYPVAEAGPYGLIGVGAYVDVHLTRWVQLEGEARWMRFNQYQGIYQDNYLLGPRLPVYHFWKASVYAKALGGFSKMQFDSMGDHGSFTDVAFGGGVDIKLTRRITFRALDAEYQYWPQWGNSSLSPYGLSMGIGYRVFGGRH